MSFGVDRRATAYLLLRETGRVPAKRRCAVCTGANDFLEWQGLEVITDGDRWAMWLWTPPPRYRHRYRCVRCGHVVEWESRSADPDLRE